MCPNAPARNSDYQVRSSLKGANLINWNGICAFTSWLVILIIPFQVFAENGVEARKIVLGTHQPLSGPLSSFSEVGRGASVFFQYLNDQGGVHGRKLALLQRDDRFQPARTLEVVTDLIMKERVFALFSGMGTETSLSVLPFIKSQSVPNFFIGSNALKWTQPVRQGIFALLPTMETEARVLGTYLAHQHPGEKVIVWFRDEPEYRGASKVLASRLRGNPLQFLPSKPEGNRYPSEWKAINAGKPRVVVALGPYGPLLKFLGFSSFEGPPIYSGMTLADSKLSHRLDKGVLNRLRILSAFPLLLENDHPGIQLHKALLSQYASDLRASRWTIYGHAVAELMSEVLFRAGRDLSREGAIRAAESLKKWQGQLMPPVFLDATNHLSMTYLRISRIFPNQVTHLSSWIDGR